MFSIGDLNAAAALIAFTVAALLIAVSLPLAPRLGLVDFPQGRKDHEHPTPVVGGIASVSYTHLDVYKRQPRPPADTALQCCRATDAGWGR